MTKLHKKLALPPENVKGACDATSLKSFMTYIVKRHDGSTRREPRLCVYLLVFLRSVWLVVTAIPKFA